MLKFGYRGKKPNITEHRVAWGCCQAQTPKRRVEGDLLLLGYRIRYYVLGWVSSVQKFQYFATING